MAFPPPPVLQHHPSHHHQRLAELPPIWKNKLDHGIHLRLYKNGDEHYAGKEVTLNKKQFRTFESWLSDLSNSMRLRNGAIWRVYTPTHGHRKEDFDDFEDGQTLVVAGQERFKPLRYDQITSMERKKSPPFRYDANPVVHNRRLLQSGKISKIETRSKLIKVWANGDDLHAPRVVLLSPKTPFTLTNVMELVSEAMKTLLNGPAEKLYLLNGIKVMDVEQVTHNGQYVALKKTDRFRMCRYNESGTKNITTSPRLERKFLAPLNYSRSNNSTQSSPEHSNASTQNSVNGHPPRRRAARRDDEQVFPARPVKHTRSSEKARNVDLDKDQGGMFKAKQSNRTTHGAREIQETRHTKTELPVDQRQAKTVEDEIIEPEDLQNVKSREEEEEQVGVVRRASHAPAYRRREEKLPKGKKTQPTRNGPSSQAGGVEARTNSKRSPPTHQQQQQQQLQRQKPQKKESLSNQHDDFEREKSAAKIQAGFRGYKTRQELKSKKKRVNTPPRASTPPQKKEEDNTYNNNYDEEEERNRAAAKIQAGVRGQQSRQKSRDKKSKPEPVLQPEDTLLGEEERAAAKIQAGFRGFKTRQQLREKNEELERERRREEEKAATKIQAGYRGYSSRKNTQTSLATTPPPPRQQQQQQPQPREDSYDSLDREISAATKIQSSYRGFMARRELDRKREAAVILPLNHNEVDRGINEDDEEDNHLGDEARALSPPDITQSREVENETQSPTPHPPQPRSPTSPQVSNDRAVDRYRSSLGDIHKAADGETKSPSRPGSSQHPSRAEGAADDNDVPNQEPENDKEDTPRASQADDRLSPSHRQDEVKGEGDRSPPEPAKIQDDPLSARDEGREIDSHDEAAAAAADASELPSDPESHGKQNGHANPVEGSQARDNNVSS